MQGVDANCPISKKPFQDPVLAADGTVYDREPMQNWLSENDQMSPTTKESLQHVGLLRLDPLKNMMEGFLTRNEDKVRGRRKVDLEQTVKAAESACNGKVDFAILRELEDSLQEKQAAVEEKAKQWDAVVTRAGNALEKLRKQIAKIRQPESEGDETETSRHPPVQKTTCVCTAALGFKAKSDLLKAKSRWNAAMIKASMNKYMAKVQVSMLRNATTQYFDFESSDTVLSIESPPDNMTCVDLSSTASHEAPSLLHRVAHKNYTQIAMTCMDLGESPDIDMKDQEGSTPLHMAAMHGQKDVAYFLLEQGAQVESQNKAGMTPLHMASRSGSAEVAMLLLQQSKLQKEAKHIDSTDKEGATPLHTAADHGKKKVAQVLLDKRAQVQLRNNDGMTPLHVATRRGHTDVASLLLENPRCPWNMTPLHVAQKQQSQDITTQLLHMHADASSTSTSRTPMTCKAFDAITDEVLFASGHSNEQIVVPGHSNQQLMMLPVRCRHGKVKTGKHKAGLTPLHMVACSESRDIARHLLKCHVQFVAMINNEWTRLHMVSYRRCQDAVVLVFDRHPSLDLSRVEGRTTLDVPIMNTQKDVSLLLLKDKDQADDQQQANSAPFGADHATVTLTNNSQVEVTLKRTYINDKKHGPLLLVESKAQTEVQVSIDARTSSGSTPVHSVTYSNNAELARLLLLQQSSEDSFSETSDTDSSSTPAVSSSK